MWGPGCICNCRIRSTKYMQRQQSISCIRATSCVTGTVDPCEELSSGLMKHVQVLHWLSMLL
jgi:hypothetical protein